MRTAFIDALYAAARLDPRVMLVTGDIGFGVVTDFARDYPAQFLNAGVAEQAMTGIAAGLALEGRIVFTYSIANFPVARCLEQIRNDVCHHRADVKVVAVGGGYAYGPLGVSHHATEDVAMMRALPGMTVFAPNDPYEATWATDACLETRGPCYLRLDRARGPLVHREAIRTAVGRVISIRPGRDAALFATGGMLTAALEAADRLDRAGVSCAVHSVPTIKPLDSGVILAEALRTGAVFTIEEHSIVGGLGSAVAEVLAEAGSGLLFRRIGLPDAFCDPVGEQAFLRAAAGLNAEGIADTIAGAVAARGRLCP